MTDNHLRILQVITGSDWGGAQQHLLWLSEGLREQGFAVSVACQPEGYLVDRLRADGFDVLPLPHMARRLAPADDWRTFRQLRRILRELQPALVHAHSSKAGALARLAAAREGVPAVFTAHGLVFSNTAMAPWKRWAYRRAERVLGQITAHLIAVSEADGALALRHGLVPPERLTVIHNGVSVPSADSLAERRRVGRLRLGLKPENFVVGVIARLHPDKDLATWLRAAALIKEAQAATATLVHKREPAIEFVLIGDGPEFGTLQALARDLGLEGAVRWAGEQPDAARLLPALDLFVLSSVKEGLPLTVLEAMAAGLPVVATAVGGVPEAVEDGRTGLLVPPRAPEALAAAMLSLLRERSPSGAARDACSPATDTLRDMGRLGRERVRREFSLPRMVERTVAVYQRVLAEGGERR